MILFALGVVSILAAPEGNHWAESWSSIRKAAATITGVEAELTQTKLLPLLTQPIVSEGRFHFRAPGQLRWEYHSPVKSLLEMKDGRVRRFLWEGGRFRADARQRTDAMQVVFSELALWIAGRFQDSAHFHATLTTANGPRLVLTPKAPALARYVTQILLIPAVEVGAIQRIVISEAGGASTTIAFRRLRMHYR